MQGALPGSVEAVLLWWEGVNFNIKEKMALEGHSLGSLLVSVEAS